LLWLACQLFLALSVSFICRNVAVQWNSAGEVQSSISKYIALIIGLCCGAYGGWYWYGKDRSSLVGVAKHLWRTFDYIVGCIGIIILSVFLMMNL
jgi:FtsH-binding integral membrane protein